MSEIATLGGGCYWCLEAFYQRVHGVLQVVSGYSGGNRPVSHSSEVYAGGTEHAEVIQVTFDPAVISYKELLEIFFTMHDPTTLNRQGNDVGDEYRSIIFYHSDTQKQIATEMIAGFASNLWADPVVTQLEPFDAFYPAEDTMQDYFNTNPNAGYCQVIINPKVQKLRQKFSAKLKPEPAA